MAQLLQKQTVSSVCRNRRQNP